MQIVPTLLTHSPEEFTTQLTTFSKYYQRFQIDVADGKFVPNTTLQIEDILTIFSSSQNAHRAGDARERAPDSAQVSSTGGKGDERQAPPKLTQLSFDFHLMVNDFEKEIPKIIELSKYIKINVILIHAARNPDLESLKQKYPIFSFGLVLNPEEMIETIESKYDFFKLTDIQIMTIHPGFQGQQFLPETLNKFNQVKAINYKINTYLDGSVNDHTLEDILKLQHPPDFIGVGSYLTHTDSLEEHIAFLETMVTKYAKSSDR